MTNWSPQQDRALMEVSRWLQSPGDQQLFRLFGYAGTGKTTLAKHLAQDVDGTVLFAAYTGKAASVLRNSGALGAQTLHSLIYNPKGKSQERLGELKQELVEVQHMIQEDRMESGAANDPDWEPNRALADREQRLKGEIRMEEKNVQRPDFSLNLDSSLRHAALLVVDECSMVDEEMAQDILSFKVPVLVLGDPAQLPPVNGAGYFTDAKPDVMLTEIHRQAKDNPIVALATRVRNGERLDHGTYGDSAVIHRATPELALAADQLLVGKNTTRAATNRRVRELRGYDSSHWPREGEKLVCLRNDRELGLLNGTLHVATQDAEELGGYVSLHCRPEEGGEPVCVPAHCEHFHGDPEQIGYWDRLNAQEFTYGYALTVHKSQGSQWGRIMIIDESSVFRQRDTRQKWLYTAITRAQEAVTVVRG
ncbi:DNA helicase I [Pseudanabaena phage Pam3]|nr:DNA helicase I [Pseudanabaena phage Pam3]